MRYPDPSFFQRRDFYFRTFAAAASQRAAAGRSFRTGPHRRSHSGRTATPGREKCESASDGIGPQGASCRKSPEESHHGEYTETYVSGKFRRASDGYVPGKDACVGQGRPGETGRRTNRRHRTGPFSPYSDARNRSVQNRAESCCQMVAVKKTPSAVHTASSSRFITRRSGFVSLRKLTSIYSLKKR